MLTPPRRSATTLATSGRRGRIDRPVQAFLEPARALDSQPAAQVLEIGVVILSEIPESRTSHGDGGAPREVCAVRCTFRAPRPGAREATTLYEASLGLPR